MALRLVAPDARCEPSFLALRREREALGEMTSLPGPPPAGFVRVPDTTLWLVDDAVGEDRAVVGRISIRHWLSDFLKVFGGHIGYEVRPARRGQGLATHMLRAALPHAHALGIDPAMLTCDADNTASWRAIERCGGTRSEEFTYDGKACFRYLLPTSAQ